MSNIYCVGDHLRDMRFMKYKSSNLANEIIAKISYLFPIMQYNKEVKSQDSICFPEVIFENETHGNLIADALVQMVPRDKVRDTNIVLYDESRQIVVMENSSITFSSTTFLIGLKQSGTRVEVRMMKR